jgi:hypothetical protein
MAGRLSQQGSIYIQTNDPPARKTRGRKPQEQYMLKKLTLAALAATFITGGAAVANAESNIHGSSRGESGSLSTSAALQGDYERDAAFSMRSPMAGTRAYGYARENHSLKHGRSNIRMKHKN